MPRKRVIPPGITRRETAKGKVRWTAKVTYRDGGTRRVLKATRDTQQEAETALAKLQAEAGRVKRGELAAERPNTVSALVDAFAAAKMVEAEYDEIGHKTKGFRRASQYRAQLDAIKERLGSKPIDAVTPDDIEEFARWLKTVPVIFRYGTRKAGDTTPRTVTNDDGSPKTRERSSTSVRRHVSMLADVFRYAVKKRYLDTSPLRNADLDPAFSREAEKTCGLTLSIDEERALIAACTEGRAHLRSFVVACLDTGRRPSEILQWTWGVVDLRHRKVRVLRQTTKTRREDTVYFGERLAAELTRIRPRGAKAEDRVFLYTPAPSKANPHPQPKPLTSIPKRAVSTAFRLAKIEPRPCSCGKTHAPSLKSLRHTHASRLSAAGTPPKVASQRLGHTRVETTMRYYVNPGEEDQRKAASLWDEKLSAGDVN